MNSDIMEAMTNMDNDDLLKDVFATQHCFQIIDAEYSHRLSCQEQLQLRSTWARWEADKRRLLWSHFRRQLRRGDGANDIHSFRLKTFWNAREKAKLTVLGDAGVASGRDLDTEKGDHRICSEALAALPEFPELHDFSPEASALQHELCDKKSNDASPAAVLPPSSESGMHSEQLKDHRSRAPATSLDGIAGLVASLTSVPATVSHKSHNARVAMKRPAGAAAGGDRRVLKKPAFAMPSAVESGDHGKDETHEDVVYACLKLLEDETSDKPRPDPGLSPGRIAASTQVVVVD